MWLVKIALTRPYTFIVLALVILIIGVLSIRRAPVDIFPSIDIPVVSVIWYYSGMPPDEMYTRITSVFERAVPTTVTNVEHMESDAVIGVSLTKLFFQPYVNLSLALSEVTAISQTLLKLLPPGITPPQILAYDASSVPIMQLILSSKTLPEQKLNDFARNFLSNQLATVPGVALPWPYGGKVRQIMIDLNPKALQTYHLSAQNVMDALNHQSLIIPSGTQKINQYEYIVKMNAMPTNMVDYNHLPIAALPEGVIYLQDVGHARDGFPPQANIVRVDGQRAVMMSILKTGDGSTLEIIHKIKSLLKRLQGSLPADLKLSIVGDQSLFVSAAIRGVIVEACIAAILTSLMIYIFLGSWRSTAVISLSIPLSILASLSILAALGETINIMTLGGLALAVGILVDDATVTIENINWHLEQGKSVQQAILDGADQIAIPAFVSTLSICIVFIPMFFLGGISQYLFVPMAEAVIFAMLTSYFLSRTLVPTLAMYGLKERTHAVGTKFHRQFEQSFERFRQGYRQFLLLTLGKPERSIVYACLAMALSLFCLWPWLGENFFPKVDGGQIKLHFEAPTGTRIEETARLSDKIDKVIRTVIPVNELESITDNLGLTVSGTNLSYSNSGTLGPQDGDILIALKKGHRSSQYYQRELRLALTRNFPGVQFSFLPADIVNQILNFGLPSPINVQVAGLKANENAHFAHKILQKIKTISGITDARVKQHDDYPTLQVELNRTLAKEVGLTAMDVVQNLFISLAGSFQIQPNFWVDPNNGVSYMITGQVPQYAMDSVKTLENLPLRNLLKDHSSQLLANVAKIKRTFSPVVVSRYDTEPVYDIFADVQDRDLASVAAEIDSILQQEKIHMPKGSQTRVRGQIATQRHAFRGLYVGLVFSILFVYLLIVVNFQSWLDPFIIITALPAALAGIAWMLFITHTPLSVPALIGTIMAMGVGAANSILIVSFARIRLNEGADVLTATVDAGVTRLRPVLMTALAMLIGMLPMSLGFGEGGEQNAPLGRAVIGGLSFATVATLFFVPLVFYTLHRKGQHEKN